MIDLKQGDCLELMKDIPDKSVDMILCDLPYGRLNIGWDVNIPADKLWKEYKRIIKDCGIILLFGIEPFSSHVRLSNEKMYRYDWIWEKSPTLPFMVHKRPMNAYENVMVFYKHLPTYNPIKTKGKDWKSGKSNHVKNAKLYGDRSYDKSYVPHPSHMHFPSNIVYFSNNHNQNTPNYHPTQKPVGLLKYLIHTYTNKGDTVLDNCMGSGSTGVACVHTERNFIGYELDQEYFNIAKKRINDTKTDLV